VAVVPAREKKKKEKKGKEQFGPTSAYGYVERPGIRSKNGKPQRSFFKPGQKKGETNDDVHITAQRHRNRAERGTGEPSVANKEVAVGGRERRKKPDNASSAGKKRRGKEKSLVASRAEKKKKGGG